MDQEDGMSSENENNDEDVDDVVSDDESSDPSLWFALLFWWSVVLFEDWLCSGWIFFSFINFVILTNLYDLCLLEIAHSWFWLMLIDECGYSCLLVF